MPKPFRVSVTNNTTGETQTLDGEFDDADWARLAAYLECAHRLARCRIVETQSELKLSVRGELGKPTTVDATLPPEDDVSAFLHRMRPFVLKDQTNFNDIRGILARYIDLAEFRRFLRRLGDRYSGKHIPFQMVIGSRAGELALTSEQAVDKWLNGFEYHQDADKQSELRSMYAVFPEETSRALFLYFMLERAAAVGKLGAFIDGLSKRDGRSIDAR